MPSFSSPADGEGIPALPAAPSSPTGSRLCSRPLPVVPLFFHWILSVDGGFGNPNITATSEVNRDKISQCPSTNIVYDKNPQNFVGRRPMTRRFAASLANQSRQVSSARLRPIGSERQKKPLSSSPRPSTLDTSTTIDVDDFKSANDLTLPMVEEMEEAENCELREVEMEDLEEEPIPYIDSCDAKNPLAVVEYVEDIYNFYRQIEDLSCVCPNYMSNQFDINERMRAILIDWLIEVYYKFEHMDETLFLTVNIIDRFLAHQTVVRKKLQVGRSDNHAS